MSEGSRPPAVERLADELRARNSLVGRRLGRLRVLGEVGQASDRFLVRCDECGREFETPGGDLRRSAKRACGCDARRARAQRAAMHRALAVVAGTGLLGAATAAWLGWMIWRYPDTPRGIAHGPVELDVPKGAGARQVADLLVACGLITQPTAFRFYAGQRGLAGQFKVGHFRIVAPASPREILDVLVKGAADELVAVTVPEGKNLLEVAELLDAAGVAQRAEVVAKATDPAFVASLGLPGPTLEGYLFPDTYKLPRRMPAARVLIQLVRRQRQVFEELKARNLASVRALETRLSFGDAQIVTLASIVEKETGQPAERPRIAQVFINRLEAPAFKPKLLQTDPTIVYGCEIARPRSAACSSFDGRIRRLQLDDRENPYNTYTHEGLPPGPIANPGRDALAAAMAPDGSPFFYFVSKNDGTHHFSRTVAEHQIAVVKYQRGGRPIEAGGGP